MFTNMKFEDLLSYLAINLNREFSDKEIESIFNFCNCDIVSLEIVEIFNQLMIEVV